MHEEVRVRFAPSPTGFLHVGGARTALFNWLYAKNRGGKFILRIEDTDLARSTDESTAAILDGLRWLGLDWDEGPEIGGDYGPYYQTQRKDLYQEYAEKLVAAGRAYWCFCSAEELEAQREAAKAANLPPGYSGKCRDLDPAEAQRRLESGEQAALRLRVEDSGTTVVNDLIRGKVTFQNEVLDDFVIIKSDGMAAYNFAVVIDDALMKITHVIRGEDHLSNTPKQIQIYQALGFEVPQFAHLSMIMGPDKARLSKRHGATSIGEYQTAGYLPAAMVNYLALLGWAYDGSQTLFAPDELVEKFSLEKVSKNPAVFDGKKLTWMNGQYLRALSAEEFYQAALPFLEEAELPLKEHDQEWLVKVAASYQTRIELLSELPEALLPFFQDPETYDEKGVAKHWQQGALALTNLKALIEGVSPYNEEALEAAFREAAEQEGKKLGQLIHPLRLALTGSTVSPGIFEVLVLLGQETALRRIDGALAFLAEKGTN